MSRDSFVFYKSFLDAIRLIPNKEDQAAALMAIVEYGCGDDPDVDGVAGAILAMAKPNIDSAAKKRADGSKGGRPKVSKDKTSGYANTKPVVIDSKNHRLDKCESNEDEDVNEDRDKEFNAQAREAIDLNEVIEDTDMRKALASYIEVRKDVGRFPYMAISALLSSASAAERKHGAPECIKIIKQATEGGWKRVPWEDLDKDKARSGTTKKGSSWMQENQNVYDMDDLESKLLEAQQ